MAIERVTQPDFISINDRFRLKKYDGNFPLFLPGYQNPVVYQNSEGIFEEHKIPDLNYVERMCSYLSRVGELYYIEAKEGDCFVPIGDVTIKDENPPIAIWRDEYRGKGVGTLVMRTVIHRLRELGYRKITGSTVYTWNLPSQKMHEKLGFVKVSEEDNQFIYELEL